MRAPRPLAPGLRACACRVSCSSHSTSRLTAPAAPGGGDAAEDVFSGIEAAQALQWQAGSRVLVHVADAPCHGSEFQ